MLIPSRKDIIQQFRPNLKKYESIYKHLHQNPELSLLESATAALAKTHLKNLGFDEIINDLGLHGFVAIFRNGNGPVILIRADMDALPVKELTGLPYASTKTQVDRFSKENPVMHACGHDVHVTCLMGAAELLHSAREHWSGTLICLFQPAEEDGAGARMMVSDGLFDKIPKPDFILGQHVTRSKAGTVQIRAGPAFAADDCFNVRLFGRGGHGSCPHRCVDPVYAACSIVVRLQSIVSREVDPTDFAVVTCVYLQTSKAINIIPDTVDMKIDVRTYDEAVRTRVIAAVKRIIRGESDASGLVKEPEIIQTDDIPPVVNDEKVVKRLEKSFTEHFGEAAVSEMVRDTGSDDFSVFGHGRDIPSAYWYIGGVDPAVWDEAEKNGKIDELPDNHSAFFAPVIHPTIQTGIDALAGAALSFFSRSTL
ncbi:putative hippurate hydrolase [Podospora fimiseda]|uniref:Hippurate hydrolase n=1 Tax=Podospora fimiseda TaxID=252190 RepID=A0AAN7BGQ1_9PEZI|nr:putative hippurate hydrolase [Podospora fimiseda]